MKRCICVVFLAIAVCMVTSTATAGDCKQIIANAGVAEYFEGCSYDGENFALCIDTPVSGNLKGTWHILINPAWNVWELTVPDGIPGIPSWDLWATWNLSVFETRKGDIITQANEVASLDALFTYGAISGMAFITGGTGDYEEATGWIGWVLTETGGGALRGEICTP